MYAQNEQAPPPDIIIVENADTLRVLTTDAQYASMKAVQNGAVYQAPLGTAVRSMHTADAPLMLCLVAQYSSSVHRGPSPPGEGGPRPAA